MKDLGGVVYVLSNPTMPDLIKIGKTTRTDPEVRMNELYTTGVPVPFQCEIAVQVADEVAAERALHVAFGPYRINPRREFFQIQAVQAKAILEVLGGKDVTPQVNAENEKLDSESRSAARRFGKRSPNLNFGEMGIPVGAELISVKTQKSAEVVGDKKVLFQGVESSLTAATRTALGLPPGKSAAPCPQWEYEGRNLSEIYSETYARDDEA